MSNDGQGGVSLPPIKTVLQVVYKGVWHRYRRCQHDWRPSGRLDWPFQDRRCERCGRIEFVEYDGRRAAA